MGQIIGGAAKPKRCNLNQLGQVPTPAAGEHILVSSDNSMNAAGQGNFDCYIVGDGTKAAVNLPMIYLKDIFLTPKTYIGAIQVDTWSFAAGRCHYVFRVNGGERVTFENAANTIYCAFLKTYAPPAKGATPDFCTGYDSRQEYAELFGFTIPSDCRYLVVNNPTDNYALTSLIINGVEYVNGVECTILDIIGKTNSNTNNITSLQVSMLKDSDLSVEPLNANLANPANIVTNKLVADTGNILPSNGWDIIGVEVQEGQKYTFGGFYLGRNGYYAFYNANNENVSSDIFADPNGRTSPKTVTAPAGATILYIDIKTPLSPANPYEELTVNAGETLLAYEPYSEAIFKIKGIPLAGGDGTDGSVGGIIVDLPVSDGTNILAGNAYIETSTGNVKVKL